MGIVIQTCKVGRAKLYKLNIKNPFVQELIRLGNMTLRCFTDVILNEEEVK